MIKKIISLFIIFSMIIALSPMTTIESKAASSKTINVLFIGNSKTYCNNMPAILSNMLTKSGKKHNYKVLVKGAMSLDFHQEYINKNKKKIKSLYKKNEKIQYVILNEYTDVQLAEYGTAYETKKIYGKLTDDVINVLKQLNSCGLITKKDTKIILNATWSYSDLADEEIATINYNFEQVKDAINKNGYKKCEIAYSGTAVNEIYKDPKQSEEELVEAEPEEFGQTNSEEEEEQQQEQPKEESNGFLTQAELFMDYKHTTHLGTYIEALAVYRAMFDTNMVANYAGSVSATKMKESKSKYISISNFVYKKNKYSNKDDLSKKAFNLSKLKTINNYKEIRDFVNKTLDEHAMKKNNL